MATMLNAGAARTTLALTAPTLDAFWAALTAAGSILPANAAVEVDEGAVTALGETPEWAQLLTAAVAAGADVAKIATAIETFRAAVAAREKAEAAKTAKLNRIGRYTAAAALLLTITLGVMAANGSWPFAGSGITKADLAAKANVADMNPALNQLDARLTTAQTAADGAKATADATASKVAEVEKVVGDHSLALKAHADSIAALEARVARLEASGLVTADQAKKMLADGIASIPKARVVADPSAGDDDEAVADDPAPKEPVACPDPAPAPKARVTKKATSIAPRKGTKKAIVVAKKEAAPTEAFATKGDVEEVATKVDSLEERLTGDEMALSGHFTGQAKREEEHCNPQAAANAAALGVFFGGRRNSSK